MSLSKSISRRLVVLATLAVAAGSADAITITRSFSANWYDPAHPGHGFSIEVVDNAAGKTMVAYWYTFDATGAPLWVYGQGTVDGSRATLQGFTTTGGRFGNDFTPGAVRVVPWGTLEVEFSDCNRGTVRWQPTVALPAGSMPIERLTSLFGSACTGGLSDDAASGGNVAVAEQFLANTGTVPGARARTRFEQRADRTDYDVELEDLPVGAYVLRVGGTARATIDVRAIAGGTEGEVEFRSPVEPGKLLLDFDPRGQQVEVTQGGTVFFRSTQQGGTTTTPPVVTGAPPTGNATYFVRFESQNDGPQIEAELEQRADRVDFQVELEDVPVGTYQLRVGGTARGSIAVVAVPGGTRGEVEFRNPVEPGKVQLDFDPRGALIEAVRNGTVVISATLPATPTGPADDGGSNGGGTVGAQSVALVSTGADPNANGEATYERTSNEQEFEVEVEDLDDGTYTLVVGGTARATIVVSGGRGEVKFNNPPRAGRLPLDFDPRGQRIDVTRNGATYLTAQFPG
jgi:hypothetical protein